MCVFSGIYTESFVIIMLYTGIHCTIFSMHDTHPEISSISVYNA